MIIYLVGISCVGKTTIGRMLAEKLDFSFYDLDMEIQEFYKKPIERIQEECFSMYEYREKVSVVLDILFCKNTNSIISGTPSGLMFSCLKVYNRHKHKDLLSVCIHDSCENIADRLTFYDKDSIAVFEPMDDLKRNKYLEGIRADYNYFKNSYKRADYRIDIDDIQLDKIPEIIISRIGLNRYVPAG